MRSRVEIPDTPAEAAKMIYLHPGQTVCSREPLMVTTILGSCAAVTLWDSARRMGAITHFMLPEWDGTGARTARYGDVAMADLLEGFKRLGSNTHDVHARVFGGGCVLNAFRVANGSHLGERNVKAAIEALNRARIGIMQRDVLGSVGRKVIFNTGDGGVSVQTIGSTP